MADETIFDQAILAAAPATDDYIGIWDTSASALKRITPGNLVANTVTGGGIVATGGFTLTVPATGTAALLGIAQTFSAQQTMSAGLDITGDRLGIGTSSPARQLHLSETGANAEMLVETDVDDRVDLISFRHPTGNDSALLQHGSTYTVVPEYTNKFVLQANGRDIAFSAYGSGDEMHFYTGGRASGDRRMTIASNGSIGINTASPTSKLDVNDDSIRIRTAKTPASATATGVQGQITWDANFLYVCVATNSWVRVGLAAW